MPSNETIEIARDIRGALAGIGLTQSQAKLYSQRIRRDMGREGLASFAPRDVEEYLDEAVLLLQAGLLERTNPVSPWRQSVKRAAELLEWLSQSDLRPPGAPLHLLAAAAYQVAGYPAMALGHLRQMPENEPTSRILREFLRAHFPATIQAVQEHWQRQLTRPQSPQSEPIDLTRVAVDEVIRCIGTLCAYLRTGSDGLIERALVKLERLASGFLHSRDQYSYLLATLTAASGRLFVETCLWPHIASLRRVSDEGSGAALDQFGRSSFTNRRMLVWPAQAAGMTHLATGASFVLCTPTGSGKTTIATIALIQNLFAKSGRNASNSASDQSGSLALYLVPSRALAAEVEARLAQDLRGLAASPVLVTGLYGGVDWGPTDAWIQTNEATIVICTYEKADALLRYLGMVFLDRVRLVVIDEAHMVEQDGSRLEALQDATSRAFRLEQLGARLFRAQEQKGFRIVALSAVAARAAPALARWVTGDNASVPVLSSYRSTRQMLGRLEVSGSGQFVIRYDLMDGGSLKFDDERPGDTPFVPSPFPSLPEGTDRSGGPDVQMRVPTLWAALQLAAERPDGSQPAVLISLAQGVDGFTKTCMQFIENTADDQLPQYRTIDESDPLWIRCLATARDYFTETSVEYRLLRRGIAVHHGKMPNLLARRLKAVIDRGFARVIIATSTLSEGVNIPVNVVLVPSLFRGVKPVGLQEFTNLIGRAGRPGVATEGSALVVLPERTLVRNRHGRVQPEYNRQWEQYAALISQVQEATEAAGHGSPEDIASSPLWHLLRQLQAAWSEIAGSSDVTAFYEWLENVAVVETAAGASRTHDYLDSLDGFLISAIEEAEELKRSELSTVELETELAAIWRRTYAFAASRQEEQLRSIWLTRGRAIKARYPAPGLRRRIYRTSLPPRSATRLIELEEVLRSRLAAGAGYGGWSTEERFEFVRNIIELVSTVPSFQVSTKLGRRKEFQNWPQLLRWWLAKSTLAVQPKASDITAWFDFVSNNFIYRAAWGMGSLIGLLLERGEGEAPVRALEIDDWPRSGLPWIAFWMKELITWGTLDPVAAFLMSKGDAIDRAQAEEDAKGYYAEKSAGSDPNGLLNPRSIREWIESRRPKQSTTTEVREFVVPAVLVRPAPDYLVRQISVVPIENESGLTWIDPAGYRVAVSDKPPDWPDVPARFEFELRPHESAIAGEAYLRHT
jgi:hypothetical protein